MDPRTRIVQEVAREWRRDGRILVPPEVTGREDERGFWAEVEERMRAAGLDPFGPARRPS